MTDMTTRKALQGQAAAVTGAASGIGFASAKAMAEAGARVVLIDRDDKALAKACAANLASTRPLCSRPPGVSPSTIDSSCTAAKSGCEPAGTW